MRSRPSMHLGSCLLALVLAVPAGAQPGFGPPGGPGGPGFGPGGEERKLLTQFDANGNGILDKAERDAAREEIKNTPDQRGRGPRGGGPRSPGGRGPRTEPATPGPKLSPADVPSYPDADLYDTSVVRTLFLTFESPDWEAELADFYNSDVEVPAVLQADGREYRGVGVHFRGASSYFMVPSGSKHSLNITMDLVDKDQKLRGFRTLNLLNCNGDPSMMSTVLYSMAARKHIAAPRADFVRVVINGESWGLYVNVEQFNADFVHDRFGSSKGARWKVKGSPNGASGLDYIGDDIEAYKRRYQIKSKDRDEDWKDLANLCRVLTETPLENLEKELEPILDIDGALWFLALDVTLANSDGYWVRASDYSIYKDPKGKFHLVPHDMNEAWNMEGGPGGGPGGFGPPGGRQPGEDRPRGRDGAEQGGPPREREQPGQPDERPRQRRGGMMMHGGPDLDPLVSLDDERKPLRSRLLKVPALRQRYLEHVRTLANETLDWGTLGPEVARLRALIAEHVKADTRKLSSFEAFETATADAPAEANARSLRAFADARRKFLLAHPEIAKLPSAGNGARK